MVLRSNTKNHHPSTIPTHTLLPIIKTSQIFAAFSHSGSFWPCLASPLALLFSVRISEISFLFTEILTKTHPNLQFSRLHTMAFLQTKACLCQHALGCVRVCNSSDNISQLQTKPENNVFNTKCLHKMK